MSFCAILWGCIAGGSSSSPDAEVDDFNPEQKAFNVIFGLKGDSMDVDLASKALNEILQKSNIEGTGKGVARSSVQLSQYVHMKGTRKFEAAKNKDPLWDREIFGQKMLALRGWDKTTCDNHWSELKNDKNVESDMSGPRHSQQCLRIPAHLCGKRGKDRT